MVNQPKDYAKPITSYDDDSNIVHTVTWCCIAFIGAFYFPFTTMLILTLLKAGELDHE